MYSLLPSLTRSTLARSYQALLALSVLCLSLTLYPQEGHAERSLFGDERHLTVERAVAWIRVNARAGNYNGRSTPLGGLALLGRRGGPEVGAPPLGYRGLDQVDQELLRAMASYVIGLDPALRGAGGSDSQLTGLNLAFLTAYRQTGGPDQVGAQVRVETAISNGVTQLKIAQGYGDEVCNMSGWSETLPRPDGDLRYTFYATLGLLSASELVPSALETLDEVINFLDQGLVLGGGVSAQGCTGGPAESVPSSATLWGYLALGVSLDEVRPQSVISWLNARSDVGQVPVGAPESYYEHLWVSAEVERLVSRTAQRTGSTGLSWLGQRDPLSDGYPSQSPSWRYDMSYQLMSTQLPSGAWPCEGERSCLRLTSAVAMATLALQGDPLALCSDLLYDQDGVCQRADNCPNLPNFDQLDGDGDGVGDLCDNCPAHYNPLQADQNLNGAGDACDTGVCVPSEELCNGLDDDCDGRADEELQEVDTPCQTGLQGRCAPGLIKCLSAQLICEPLDPPELELCDAIDNDCDGDIDEGNPQGDARCPTGEQGLCGVGFSVCEEGGFLRCVTTRTPSPERCDGLDNDCDGLSDEGNPGGDMACLTSLQGACSEGQLRCLAGELICARDTEPALELCDAQDNDCDGLVDEGAPGSGQPCLIEGGVGRCGQGVTSCASGVISCVPVQASPLTERCDGQDNDCDGRTDEQVVSPDPTTPSVGDPCETVCGQGVISCALGALRCDGPNLDSATPELCDGLDNDCDGVADEALDDLGFDCTTGAFGLCASGRLRCREGSPTCVGELDAQLQASQSELCNTLDDDCDGLTDEATPGEGLPCVLDALGVCARGLLTCRDGSALCYPLDLPTSERCDGLDNDCDGQTDEALVEQGQPCVVTADDIPLLGRCAEGVRRCEAGASICEQRYTVEPEVCDGLDNDCDGRTDEEALGLGGLCDTGELGRCGEGVSSCVEGEVRCSGSYSPPTGVASSRDLCDGLDDDCDGRVDEADPQVSLRCDSGLFGICSLGRWSCLEGQLSCAPDVLPVEESCDGLDNDCDDLIDEGDPEGGFACRVADERGLCSVGVTRCAGARATCVGEYSPSAELCDGLDNDCDGLSDEGELTVEGSCSTGRPGECAEGAWRCEEGGLSCTEVTRPSAERCDGLDNDCDGAVDEDLTIPDASCVTGSAGVCAEGRSSCEAGGQACLPVLGSSDELCDGLDNDCDGVIDEGLRNACGRCGPLLTERCDGEDNDCDGLVDEQSLGDEPLCDQQLACAGGRCVPSCQGGECPDEGDLCLDGGCVPRCLALTCAWEERCEGGRCVDPCEGVSCVNGLVCHRGECVIDSCYETGCPDGQRCLQSLCVDEPCMLTTCEPSELCRVEVSESGATSAVCVGSCATVSCALDERCEDGVCVTDLCAERSCQPGQVCREGLCLRDPCAGVVCGAGRACIEGSCVDDPCAGAVCPAGERCEVRSDRAQCAPSWLDELEAGAEAGAEAGTEAGLEAGLEAGASAGAEAGVMSAGPLDMGMSQGGATPSSADFGLAPISPVGGELGALSSPKDEGCQSTGGELPATSLPWLLLSLLALMKRYTSAKLV